MKQFRLMILLSAVCLQLIVPASMIIRHETALSKGNLYRFKVRFYDPGDPLQGRYIQLDYDIDYPDDVEIDAGSKFAVLGVDEDGYARFTEIRKVAPSDTSDYIGVNMEYSRPRLFCDRYYLKETVAPEAEAFYFSHLRDRTSGVVVDMRVRKGHGVIETIRVDGVPLLEAMEAEKTDDMKAEKADD